MKKFFVTCAIPYVNAAPHIGHALEFIQGDTISRYHKMEGYTTKLLSGGDENALKNVQAAQKAEKPVQEFIDENTAKFHELTQALHCDFSVWQKGSDTTHHFPASQKLWELCEKNRDDQGNPDIYKQSYEGLYCVGCEAFYTKEELNEHGECFEHPGKKLELVKETNYFFRLSRYQERLIAILSGKDPEYHIDIIPEKRKNEVLAFLQKPLLDISISRSNERARNWGVPVPGDATQRMYVWFDALNIYQSGVGFGWDENQYEQWWPADVHVIGKGITRFHAIYWPAFLLSAHLKLPKKIFVHEYFTVNGQKMSKTLGNVIDPITLIEKYGAEPLRYYFLAKFSPFSDGDFSEEEFIRSYNADLANGLGNLVSRVARLTQDIPSAHYEDTESLSKDTDVEKKFHAAMQQYVFNEALFALWEEIRAINIEIDQVKPWEYKKDSTRQTEIASYMLSWVKKIKKIGLLLAPIMPETSSSILSLFQNSGVATKPLFPRISTQK